MIKLFHEVSQQCSKAVTEKYSTSFSSAIKLLHADLRTPIYNIYGFVRFADEIVDRQFRLHFSFITAMCLTVLVVCPTYVIIHILIK